MAILGGTFNPVHNGHLALAEQAVKTFMLEKVIFIPTYITPQKFKESAADAEDRYAMVKLAISDNEKFEISRLEINRKKVSYSIDTITYLKKIYPASTELFFLMGSDLLKGLDTWKDIDKLLTMCKIIVGPRRGDPIDTKYKNIEIMPMAPVDISATDIRKRIKADKNIDGLVTEKVADYIKKFGLYR